MEYNFDEHTHRFSTWTAARAVQRSFTKTENIVKAIDTVGLREFSESTEDITQSQYDLMHERWSQGLTSYFESIGIECSYGRAAKIIAVYLKTSWLLPNKGQTKKCEVIHPPIDRILLKKLAASNPKFAHLSKINWTGLNSPKYWELVHQLRKEYPFNWQLESNWQV